MDLTGMVERFEAMEQELGIELRGIYAQYDEESITVNCEINATKNRRLPCDIEVVVAVYDDQQRVIGTNSTYIDSETFSGFRVISVYVNDVKGQVRKIRVYPQKN